MIWREIPIELRVRRDPGYGIESTNRFYVTSFRQNGWGIYVYPNERYDTIIDTDDRGPARWWDIEVPCVCTKDITFLHNKFLVPTTRNRIIVGCRNCERQIFRVTGIRDLEWNAEVIDEIYQEMS